MNTFEGKYEAIPEGIKVGILRYVEYRIPPGSFLTAVLNNDLQNAIFRADAESLKTLPLVVQWFHDHKPDLYGADNFKRHTDTVKF